MARWGWLTLLMLVGCSRTQDESSRREPSPTEPPLAAKDVPPIPDPGALDDPAESGLEGPPPDHGHLKFTDGVPSPERLTHHALAGYVVVAVYDQPNMESRQLGYIRFGTRMKVTEAIEGPGCPKGWHGLPQGGYACASKGLVVDKRPPYMPGSPPSPALDDAIPYRYAFVRRWNTPMWWRIPSKEERSLAEQMRAEKELERQALELAAQSGGQVPGPAGAQADGSVHNQTPSVEPLPSLDEEPSVPQDVVAGGGMTAGSEPQGPTNSTDSPVGDPEEDPIKLPLSPETPWLERGFFLSIGEKTEGEGGPWWRTARGAYVEVGATSEYSAKDYEGAVLDEVEYPYGFVMADDVTLFQLEEGDRLKKVKTIERRTFVDIEEKVDVRGASYFLTKDGLLVKEKVVRLAELQPRPADLAPWERWIDVSLSTQMLIAYEGDEPVFITLVSTGKKGTEEEPFETPTGRWRVRSKHISTTMDGNTASDGNYSIQDVPWAMFFEGSYALHGAFWHRGFGYRRSHGCVNLGPSDARWLFFWTTPYLPSGWHGVLANDDALGTTVIVRE